MATTKRNKKPGNKELIEIKRATIACIIDNEVP